MMSLGAINTFKNLKRILKIILWTEEMQNVFSRLEKALSYKTILKSGPQSVF